MTVITCQKDGGQATLNFDEHQAAFLQAQLDKGEAFQRRMKIAAIVAIAILFAGGVVTISLCYANIIPYGPMNTLAILGGTSVTSLSFGAGMVCTLVISNDDPSCFTYHRLKKEFNQRRPITTEKAWIYLTKYQEEYRDYLQKQRKESLLERIPVKDLTNIVLDYLND